MVSLFHKSLYIDRESFSTNRDCLKNEADHGFLNALSVDSERGCNIRNKSPWCK